jgi:DNA modification methylase
MLNRNFYLNNLGVSNALDTLNIPRHRWYYYKEGFSPNLVKKAIESSGIEKDDIILDPFNGSGTTTLTSSLNNYKSIGIEVNPFTAFLSKTKVKNADIKKLNDAKELILNNAEEGGESSLKGYSTFSETDKITKWLFNDGVLDTFAGGWMTSKKIASHNLRKVIQLALIISAMQNCNATRDGKCLRYRENWKDYEYNKDTFLSSLKTNFSIMSEDIKNVPILKQPKILKGDARTILLNNNIGKFKLCVTSPPYLNTFDYTDIYRPELFLGEFVKNNNELHNLRLKTIRSHIQAKWPPPSISSFGELYKNSIKHILEQEKNLMDKKIPIMIQAYFEDMLNILKLLRKKAEKDAHLWMVVSNSAYADKEIQVDLIIAEMAGLANWKLKEVGVLREIRRRKTKYSPHVNTLRESVVILEAGKNIN